MENKSQTAALWNRALPHVAEAVEAMELLAEPATAPLGKRNLSALLERWFRASGFRIPYLPGPIEKWAVRKIASGLADSLADFIAEATASSLNAKTPRLP